MKKLILLILLLSIFEVTACQNPPARSEQDVIEWESRIYDYRKDHGDSVIIDISFPTEFNGYPFTSISLIKGDGNAPNEFIFPIGTTDGATVRAFVGQEVIDELILTVSYTGCGYTFNYKISEHGGNGV